MRWLPLFCLLSGCSFVFVPGPPSEHAKMQYFDCDSSAAAPVADMTGAALEGLLAVSLADDTSGESGERVSTAVPVTFGVLAAVQVASAIYGISNASSCRAAKRELADRIAANETHRTRQLAELDRQINAQSAGCSRDSECKGERICVQTQCVDPPKIEAPQIAPDPAAPAPAASAPAPAVPEAQTPAPSVSPKP